MLLEFVEGKVRIYQKKISRKLKNGTNKTYNTEQQTVTLKKNNMFEDGQSVAVIPFELFNMVNDNLKEFEDREKQLKEVTERYNILTETNQELENDIKRLRNSKDHTQERLTKSLEETNQLYKIIGDLSNRGFIDYITGRLPESYKQLQAPKNENDK
jgi:cell shape-determining protein MreC